MNRKTFSRTFSLLGIVGLMTVALLNTAQAETQGNTTEVQKMDVIVISADYLPTANAAKLERIVVTAKRDRSDMKPEPIARGDSRPLNVSGSRTL